MDDLLMYFYAGTIILFRQSSSMVEHVLHENEVEGSIPSSVTMSTSDWYNKIEGSIANLTTLALEEALDYFSGTDRMVLEPLFNAKIKKNKNFRPLVFFVGYCVAKGRLESIESISAEEIILISQITAAIEVENIGTYYVNHYLDNKGDIKNKRDEKNRVLAGLLCRNLSEALIDSTPLTDHLKLCLINIMREIDNDITKAQIYEINTGLLENIGMYQDEQIFIENYFERCRKISGQFYGRSAEMGYLVGSMSSLRTDQQTKIKDFYTNMATIGQFGNDIGDYALPTMHSGTIEKNYYKDYGSDLINQRLTYPNYLLFKRITDSRDEQLVNTIIKNGFTGETVKMFNALMTRLRVYEDCFKHLKCKICPRKKET